MILKHLWGIVLTIIMACYLSSCVTKKDKPLKDSLISKVSNEKGLNLTSLEKYNILAPFFKSVLEASLARPPQDEEELKEVVKKNKLALAVLADDSSPSGDSFEVLQAHLKQMGVFYTLQEVAAISGQGPYEEFLEQNFKTCCSNSMLNTINLMTEEMQLADEFNIKENLRFFELGEKKTLFTSVLESYFAQITTEQKKKILSGVFSFPMNEEMLASEELLQKRQLVAIIAYSGPFMHKIFQQVGGESNDPYMKEMLEAVKYDLPSMKLSDVESKIITSVGGLKPIDPSSIILLSAASIAQTAIVKDTSGKEYVVKIRKPGVKETLLWEKELILNLPSLNSTERQMLSDMFESFVEETDFRIESENLREASRYYRDPVKGIYVVNLPVDASNSEDFMLMERAPGSIITTYTEGNPLLERAKAYSDFYVKWIETALNTGFFHADPHSGNVLFQPSVGSPTRRPVLTPVDFGAVGRLTPAEIYSVKLLALGLRFDDLEHVYDGLNRLTGNGLDRFGDPEHVRQNLTRIMQTPTGSYEKLNAMMKLLESWNLFLPKNFVLFFRADDYFKKQISEINDLLPSDRRAFAISEYNKKLEGLYTSMKKNKIQAAYDAVCVGASVCSKAIKGLMFPPTAPLGETYDFSDANHQIKRNLHFPRPSR